VSAPVEIRVEKRFRHPPERVFDAFLDPARVGEWLFHTPEGVMERTDYDPRPGGSFAIFERRGRELARHFGRFVEIERPQRVVFDFWVDEAPDEPTRVTVTFLLDGDGCLVTLTHELAPEWASYEERTSAGWSMILKGLASAMGDWTMAENWLDGLVGEWTYESHGVPDQPEHRRSGVEIVTRRGAWVVIESGDEYRFQIALDPKTGKATGDFIHWEHPTLWTYEGALASDGKLHLKSRGPSFDVEGEVCDYDDVFEIVSPDERRMAGRCLGPDGEWRDFTITRYRRRT